MKIEGTIDTHGVGIDGKTLSPAQSQKIRNHSPDGFNWGYGGSGPVQLALAICIKAFGVETASRVYQQFKRDVIAKLPQDDFSISVDMGEWLRSILRKGGN